MAYIIVCVVGILGGAVCVFLLMDQKRRNLQEKERQLDRRTLQVQETLAETEERENALDDATRSLRGAQKEFAARAIAYKELEEENTILKQHLLTVHLASRKMELDVQQQQQFQNALDERAKELGDRYLRENVKWIGSSLNANNFSNCKQRLIDVINRCRGIGLDVQAEKETGLLADLKAEYEKAVRASFQREEQARIKAQIREEQLREMEIERELKQLEREREAIRAALQKALADAQDQHSEEVDRLRMRLADAEARTQRAISQAQLTKAGHIYVISNIGSFGQNVFKIGMTRRLEPAERVRELSSASVPFPFDVHMMIACDDAPTLENALHRALHKARVNKANPRKEFFRTKIETICEFVKKHHGEVQYLADVEALEYHQSLTMSDEDQKYIEDVYSGIDEEDVPLVEEV
jgi:hypothetical protein